MNGNLSQTTGDYSLAQQANGNIYNGDAEDLGIIGEIFDYVVEQRENNGILLPTEQPTQLLAKINLNFDGSERNAVHDRFVSAGMVRYKNLIESFLEISSEARQDDVEELVKAVENYYRTIKNSGAELKTKVEDYLVLYRMSQELLPNSKKKNPKYQDIAFAIIYYFFEKCRFGLKE